MKKDTTTISCKKAAELLSESFEHPLPLSKKIALKTHLALCRTCVYCARQLQALRAVFRNYDSAISEQPPPDSCCLPDDAKKRLKESLNKADSSSKK